MQTAQNGWFTLVNAQRTLISTQENIKARSVQIKKDLFTQLRQGLMSGAHDCIYVFEHNLNSLEKLDLLSLANMVKCPLHFHEKSHTVH
jgi:hypothetical protein